MQSSELRWTFRDQEVATEERGEQQFPNGSCWGALQKKLIAPSAGGAPAAAVFVRRNFGNCIGYWEKKKKKNLKIDIFQGTSGVRPCHRVQIPAAVPSKLGFFRVTGGLLGL
jgi:hypothetical protein